MTGFSMTTCFTHLPGRRRHEQFRPSDCPTYPTARMAQSPRHSLDEAPFSLRSSSTGSCATPLQDFNGLRRLHPTSLGPRDELQRVDASVAYFYFMNIGMGFAQG